MHIRVAEGSLTEGSESVWVNASNTQLLLGSGVSAAIRAACGRDFQTTLTATLANRGRPLTPGEVVVTGAGASKKAKYVAHVAVMDYRNGVNALSMPGLDRVRTACTSLWSAIAALDVKPRTVAMVALGAGTGGLGLVDSVTVACETLTQHTEKAASPIEGVTFYGYSLHEYLAMAGVVVRFFPQAAQSLSSEARKALKL